MAAKKKQGTGKNQSTGNAAEAKLPSAPVMPKDKQTSELIDQAKQGQSTRSKSVAAESEADKPLDPKIDKELDELLSGQAMSEDTEFDKPDEKPSSLKPKKPTTRKKWVKILLALVVLVVLALLVPISRYALLNFVGVRAAISMVVVDESTGQPLKNVQVTISETTAITDELGNVRLTDLRLGNRNMQVERVAFAPLEQQVTVDWRDGSIGKVGLTATGAQYRFVVTDFLSGDAIKKAEAVSGSASAVSNENGEIVLSVDVGDTEEVAVSIIKDQFRTEKKVIAVNQKRAQNVQMVPSRKHVFVGNDAGGFGLHTIDADGKNEKVIVSPTGNEEDDTFVVPHPTENIAALVSTRDGVRAEDGTLLRTLHIVDLASGKLTEVASSINLQIIDWSGDHLVFVKTTTNAKPKSPGRHRLITYNYRERSQNELARSNYFNDVLLAKGIVYYAPSSAFKEGEVNLYKVDVDGKNNETILFDEAWNLIRNSYDTLRFSVQKDWYEYFLGDVIATKLDAAPKSQKSRLYRDNPSAERSLWIDLKDGKSILKMYNTKTKETKRLYAQSGLRSPVYWLNDNYAVFRMKTVLETADYVVNVNGGKPKKIHDVADTGGVDDWYYYQ